MSASDKKKLKKAAMADGMTQKQRQEAEAAQAAKRKKTIYWAVGIVCTAAAAALLIWNNIGGVMNHRHYNDVAATVDGTNYTVGDLQYYYGGARNNIIQTQNAYLTYYGFSMGYNTSLSDGAQWYSESAGQTWADYFRESALTSLKQVSALCRAANEAGYTLSEDGQASIDEALHDIDSYRAMRGQTRDGYLAQIYGEGVTEEVFLRNLTASTLASEFSQDHQDSISYDDDALDAYYQEHPDTLDSYDYRIFTISGTPETKTDSEGNTVPATDEEKAAAKENAKAQAEAAVKEIEEAEDREKAFIEAAPKYVSENTKEAYSQDKDYSLQSGILGSNVSQAYAGTWLMDKDRKTGDVTYVEAADNYQVVLFLKRYLDKTNAVNIRHILIMADTSDSTENDSNNRPIPTQAALDAAKAEAESLMSQWQSGDKTAESFGALAKDHSDDPGSKDNGGAYDHVYKNEMFEGFDEWIFDPSRKAGDVGLVENPQSGQYGWHVIYFEGTDGYWERLATNTMKSNAQSEWLTALTDAVEAVTADGMQYVGAANTAVPTATPTPTDSEQPSDSETPSESEEPSASPAQ